MANNIREVQRIAKKTPDLTLYKEGLLRINRAIFIPVDALEIKLKYLYISHGVIGGHRRQDGTLSSLKE